MQRLSVSEFSSFRWSFFQDVVKLSNLGFGSIGLWRSKVTDYGIEEAADLLSEMHASVSSLSWAGGFTGSNGVSHKDAIEDAIEAVYQAHMVGADKLIVHAGARNGHTESHAMRLLSGALAQITPIACDLGVTLLLEPISNQRNPWNFLTHPRQYLELLNEFPESELGLVIDLFHIGRSQQFADFLPKLANRIRLVQLSDGRFAGREFNRCQLGDGIIPVDRWLQLLVDNEYEGEFELELHGPDFELADYGDVLQKSQHFFNSAMSRTMATAAKSLNSR